MCLNSLRENAKLPINWYFKVNRHFTELVGIWPHHFYSRSWIQYYKTEKGIGLQGFKVQQL